MRVVQMLILGLKAIHDNFYFMLMLEMTGLVLTDRHLMLFFIFLITLIMAMIGQLLKLRHLGQKSDYKIDRQVHILLKFYVIVML